jgi:anti-sigma factor RsiW
MDCRNTLALLEPYLDNELDRADARELEAHVDGCADCRSALSQLDDLRRALRDPALHHVAPPELRERIRTAQLGGNSSGDVSTPSFRSARRWLPAWSRVAAACVLAFVAGGVSMHVWTSAAADGEERSRIVDDLFAGHWRALAAASPIDVVSSDRHTVKPWFAGKVASAPLVQDFADQDFPLVGGRVDYVGSERVPVLVYRHGKHLIDVFVLPQSDAVPVARSARRQGYSLDAITLGGQPAAMVSDMDPQESAKLGNLLKSAR